MTHFDRTVLVAIAMAAFAGGFAAEETTLFDFARDPNGFYCFKNEQSEMTLAHVRDSAGGSSGSLRSEHCLKGNSAYGGLGVGFDHVDAKLGDWAPMGAQGAVWLTAKASSPDELEVKLLAKEGVFSLRLNVGREWARYTLPFRFFEGDERKVFDPTTMVLRKLEIRPNRRNSKEWLLIDAIGLKSNVRYEPRDEVFEAQGVVTDAKGTPLGGAVAEVLTEHPDVHGWYPIRSVRTEADGRIALRCITRKATRYLVEGLDAEGKPLAADDAAPGARPHVLEIACSGFKTQRKPIRAADAAQYADLRIALAPVDDAEAAIAVAPDEKVREIDPLVYGANVGLWHAGDFKNPNVVAAAREAGITILRYPGGARSQGARWQRTEAPWDSKPADGGKGDCVLTPAKVSEFIEFCRKVGAEPMISLNLESRDQENAADLVRFLNVEKKYGVKYFEFGNEPECYAESWELGRNWTHDPETLGRTYREVARVHREYAAMLKEIDPSALDMGPVSANADFYDLAIPPFWEAVGSTLSVLSVHRYPQTDQRGSGHWDDAKLLRAPLEWADLCARLKTMERRYSPDRRPLLAVTEWNTCYHTPGPRQQQIVGALFTARNLGEMIKGGVDIANYWVLTGCGAYNLFHVADRGAVEKLAPYFAFSLFSNHLRGTLVRAESGDPNLSVYAAKNGKELTLAFVNVSPDTRFRCKPNLPANRFELRALHVVERTRPCAEIEKPPTALCIPAYSVLVAKYRILD